MRHNKPYISVLMSVYNAEKYVGDCIRSILGQTFTDFEFIIINDASTDSSPEIIKSFKDKRIRLLNNHVRSYPTRNKGLRVAKGKYLCIMDADDISMPLRFERQVLFMDNHPEFGLAGSGYRILGQDKDLFRESDYEKIKVHMMRNSIFIHPSVIIRHDLLKKHNLKYIRKYYYASDYDFLTRAARYFPVTNIPEVLMYYRIHEGQVTIQFRAKQSAYADEISLEQVKYLGINPTAEEARLHINLLHGRQIDYSKKDNLYKWLGNIKNANCITGFYNKNELEHFFDALLSQQLLCRETPKPYPESERNKDIINNKTNLMDVTFAIPLMIDSHQMIEDTNTVVRYINQQFETHIIILEADSEQRYFPEETQKNLTYKFIEDHNKILHRTKWINHLMAMATTPYLAVWDAGVISPPEQIIEAIKMLRSCEVVISFPYDGRTYSCDKISCRLFKNLLNIEVLLTRVPEMRLTNGYHFPGRVFIVNNGEYKASGGENENITKSSLEGPERLKRMEVLNLPIFHTNGPLFHLRHPTGNLNRFPDSCKELRNIKEFLKTCLITN